MKNDKNKYNFGWKFIWMNGYWIVGSIFLSITIWLLINLSFLQFLGIFLLIISIILFGGNFVWRRGKSPDYLTLPYVNLISSEKDSILDAGCGTGRTTIELSKVIGNGHIIALDKFDASYIDEGGRQLLEENLKVAKIENKVDIVKGDITDLDFEENTFDSIISAYALDHIRKQKFTALKELNRVLKQGGRFLLIVFIPNIYTFLLGNVLSFHLTSRKKWREFFPKAGFELSDEGIINGGTYFLLEKVKS